MKRLLIEIPFLFSLIIFFVSCSHHQSSSHVSLDLYDSSNVEKTVYGFNLNDYEVNFDTIKSGWTWNDLFSGFNISQHLINQTAEILKGNPFNLKYINAGKSFATFKAKHSGLLSHLVYEVDPFSYIKMDFSGDSINIDKGFRQVDINEKIIAGAISQNSSLNVELNNLLESYAMTADMTREFERIYAWSIDFFRLQPEDKFIAVYDEKSIEGKAYSADNIKYAWFEHAGKGIYAFYYEDTINGISGFYNEKGEEMKQPFLKAPVEYSRISSPYNKNRFHPVLKTRRAHLGTDYAAPTGTPIRSTADGVVEAASRTSGNGLYVKIRHNATYQTQYLHMSKIGPGMKKGVRVQQGDVIGYVGQTGLATGPHVCYRFWKNGVQIDPRSEVFPNSEPMKEEAIPAYLEYIAPLKEKLDKEMENTFSNLNVAASLDF